MNAAIFLLNHLTVVPFFSLFRTGTFYSDSAPGRSDGAFTFVDDLGNETRTNLTLPTLTLAPPAVEIPVSASALAVSGAAPFIISMKVKGDLAGADLECSLQSSHLDAQGARKTEERTREPRASHVVAHPLASR